MQISRHIKRLTLVSTSVAALLGGVVIASSSADLQSQLNASKSTAASLQSQINSEASQIEKTRGGVAAAEEKLSSVNAALDAHIAQLRAVQTNLMTARDQLLALENKLHLAAKYLAANLRSEYENGSPNLVDVILNAHGFSSLLDQVNYIKDAQHQDDEIVQVTRIARARVQSEALHLDSLEIKDRNLTNDILAAAQPAGHDPGGAGQAADRRGVDAVAHQGPAGECQRADGQAPEAVRRPGGSRSRRAAAAAQRGRGSAEPARPRSRPPSRSTRRPAGSRSTPGRPSQAPAGAPSAVVAMIAAGNAIATLPYIWGGGHASFQSLGYDCSGSVSYVLNAGGLLSAPEVSGDFESYGDPGPGQWVTIYANAGHVWMDDRRLALRHRRPGRGRHSLVAGRRRVRGLRRPPPRRVLALAVASFRPAPRVAACWLATRAEASRLLTDGWSCRISFSWLSRIRDQHQRHADHDRRVEAEAEVAEVDMQHELERHERCRDQPTAGSAWSRGCRRGSEASSAARAARSTGPRPRPAKQAPRESPPSRRTSPWPSLKRCRCRRRNENHGRNSRSIASKSASPPTSQSSLESASVRMSTPSPNLVCAAQPIRCGG